MTFRFVNWTTILFLFYMLPAQLRRSLSFEILVRPSVRPSISPSVRPSVPEVSGVPRWSLKARVHSADERVVSIFTNSPQRERCSAVPTPAGPLLERVLSPQGPHVATSLLLWSPQYYPVDRGGFKFP